MSGFLIASSSGSVPIGHLDTSLRTVIAAYERKQQQLTGRIEHHGYAVLLFRNRWHDPQVALSTSSAGSFCTYVGTLLYRGQTAKDATSALLRDLSDGDSNCLNSILGNYCLIFGDSDGIRVITDRAGLHHTYYTADLSLICNSFIGAAQYLTKRSLVEHEMLQYILYGATFGTQTLVRDVLLLDPQFEIRLQRAQRTLKDRGSVWQSSPEADSRMDIEDHLSTAIQIADNYYGQVGATFGSKITAALTGGHDSRLNLAFLRRHEICPKLFVYGASDDPDVKIAKSICIGEGLALQHIDRGNSHPLDPEGYWSNQEDVFHGVDGLTQYGFACDPDEISQRRQRVDGGLLAINGGGGEIWRDYWKLPDKPLMARDFVRVPYASDFGRVVKDRHSKEQFYRTLASRVLDSIGKSEPVISASEIQSLYPRFRLRFWQGKNNSVNNGLGYAVTPFSEHHFSVPAMSIPLWSKRGGWFERQLLMRVSKTLASYTSGYGFDFVSGPPLLQRVATGLKYRAPLRLRAIRRTLRRGENLPYYLSAGFRAARFGQRRYEIERFVHLNQILDPLMLSRALTVERMLRDDWISMSF